jgi:hypothetical protein
VIGNIPVLHELHDAFIVKISDLGKMHKACVRARLVEMRGS